MENWCFLTRKQCFVIEENEIRECDDPRTSLPVIVGPSLCFRKFFEIPMESDLPREDLSLEAFSGFLPGEVSEFRCQFHYREETTEEDIYRVLGLAVRNEKLDGRVGDQPIHLLEYYLRDWSPAQNSLLQLSLPGGSYWGFYNLTLCWARFLSSPDEQSRQNTQQFVEANFSRDYETLQSPGFDEDGQWVQFIRERLPEELPRSSRLGDTTAEDIWGSLQNLLRAGIGLLAVAFVLLGVSEWYATAHYQTSIRSGYENEFDESVPDPLERLRQKRNQRRSLLQEYDRRRTIYQYPRVAVLDDVLDGRDLRLLRLGSAEESGQVVLLSPNLNVAEQFVSDLNAKRMSGNVEIRNTRSVSIDDYQFEVVVDVDWDRSRSS